MHIINQLHLLISEIQSPRVEQVVVLWRLQVLCLLSTNNCVELLIVSSSYG